MYIYTDYSCKIDSYSISKDESIVNEVSVKVTQVAIKYLAYISTTRIISNI